MKASIIGKRALSSVLQMSGYVRKRLKDTAQDGLLILMYHRVVDDETAHRLNHCGMYVAPETFDRHLRFLKRHFHVVPLSEAAAFLGPGGPKYDTGGNPTCAITFDDGWRDVYENAFPLLRSHGMAATVFLPTGFIGTRSLFWTDRMANLLHEENSILALRKIANDAWGGDIDNTIKRMKRLRQEEIDRILEELNEDAGRPSSSGDRAFLTWEEVGEMYRSGIIRFGSHTETHRILTTLSDDEITSELVNSKDRLLAEGVVDTEFIPFAYPNGNHTEHIANIVRASGYNLAVTTEKGWNQVKPGLDGCRLKRIGIHQDITATDALFGARIAGIF